MKNTTAKLPETYLQLSSFRTEDSYPDNMNVEEIVTDFFPATFPELVQRLSDITGAFYGGMLKQAGDLFGKDKINTLSVAMLHDLGVKTAARNLQARPYLQSCIPDMIKILIGTVFTSSPEYKFEVLEVNENKAAMLVKGIDRYHKIALALGMAELIEWPAIRPFVQGVCDGMGLQCNVHMVSEKPNSDKSECLYTLMVTR